MSKTMGNCLFVFYVPSTARSFRDDTPIYCPFSKDVKLGKYTVPTGDRTSDRRVAVHYATAAPRKLHTMEKMRQKYNTICRCEPTHSEI